MEGQFKFFLFCGLILTVTEADFQSPDPLVSFYVHGKGFYSRQSHNFDLKESPTKSMTYEERMSGDPDQNMNLVMVSTPTGQNYRGTKSRSRQGKWFYSFCGIKYATAQRFELPQPVPSWTGTLDARTSDAWCPQISETSGEFIGEEDCLYLSVHFPYYAHCQEKELPVAFNIHGGGFVTGSSTREDRGPAYFMDQCVCLVSINYRLGALGFLTTHDETIRGNLGMHDQVMALKWVQDNIQYFRGDKNRVTIFGISAGGASVSHLMASPLAAGLFTGAISQSGTALSPWAIQRTPLTYAKLLASALKCPAESNYEMRACLETKTPLEIVVVQDTLGLVPLYFVPVIEPKSTVNPFQIENPAVLFRTGNFNKVPYICGFLEDEVPLQDKMIPTAMDMAFDVMTPMVLFYDQLGMDETEMNEISAKIRQFYFGDKAISSSESNQNVTNCASDRLFIQGTMEKVNLTSKFIPVYPYVMTYKGGDSVSWSNDFETPAIVHSDDAQFFFNGNTPFQLGTEQYDFSINLLSLWSSFIKSGKPWDSEWRPAGTPVNNFWRRLDRLSSTPFKYLNERFLFWQNLGLSKYEYY